MITAKISFVAEGVVRDAESNAISAFNIIEGITPAGLPFFLQRISYFVLWERHRDDLNQIGGRFVVLLNGRELISSVLNLDFGSNMKTRTIVNVGALVVPEPGSLTFRVDLDGDIWAEYSVEIIAPAPVAAAEVQPAG